MHTHTHARTRTHTHTHQHRLQTVISDWFKHTRRPKHTRFANVHHEREHEACIRADNLQSHASIKHTHIQTHQTELKQVTALAKPLLYQTKHRPDTSWDTHDLHTAMTSARIILSTFFRRWMRPVCVCPWVREASGRFFFSIYILALGLFFLCICAFCVCHRRESRY